MSRPPRRTGARRGPRRPVDPARRAAFDALRAVHAGGAYANLALAEILDRRHLDERDAALATELVAGSSRLQGTYDAILEAAAGRPLSSLQPAAVDVLRLGTHQVLSMRIPTRAAVDSAVDLAGTAIGERVTGLVNAVLRKVAAHDLDAWVDRLSAGTSGVERLALRTHHPRWIAQTYADLLGEEAAAALEADNVAPRPTLVVRPGLTERDDLVAAGATATRWSPYGAVGVGNPGDLVAVRDGRAGVQDEGSQLVALALSRVEAPAGRWLDMCAGPGGKAALLTGLARARGEDVLAAEVAEHRAGLVAQALRAYRPRPGVICADGTRPAWRAGAFARVMLDAPCTGLGALRRRPESRWRHQPEDVDDLVPLQAQLLVSAIRSTLPGGVVAYVTCSPHPSETEDVVQTVVDELGAQRTVVEVLDAPAFLPEVPACGRADPWGGQRFVQLWPHRHGTDAMFLALLRVG
ncbi:RsmB/NOP family class I SAM-dependent RNA methyltransferase [Raineyella sp. LH-20]|uniref:RsmB/NOP family class I SAM-dependent RNA methyltransferase n=1 Tax=Raineyella sp. LH-20 TaxID=3081204 RepID=UPI002955D72A|nr:transcription antitermination factor NusB [Raineyella sp. LH-20]WOP18014.1 transcription antitermination factor NusB [Raineyella sp. LH-20]